MGGRRGKKKLASRKGGDGESHNIRGSKEIKWEPERTGDAKGNFEH